MAFHLISRRAGDHRTLQWAVSANDVAVATTLLAAGAAVDGPQGDGPPLSQALFYGQPAAVAALLAHGADRGVTKPQHQATALGWTIHHKREAIAAVLRHQGEPDLGE